jgi:hypothetical protein
MIKLFRDWTSHFSSNDWSHSNELDWINTPLLSNEELHLIAPSLAQFQLGENAQGRHLLSRATAFATAHGVPYLTESTWSFIKEEQRHSQILGRFLSREGHHLLERDTLDGIFRWMRKLAGFELCVTVLSTAECLAVPYYTAVRDLTTSGLLKRICKGILRDEALHLCYQGQVLGLFSRRRGFWRESLVRTLHRLLLLLAGVAIFVQHAKFFRAAGMSLQSLLGRAFQALAQIEQRTGAPALVGLGWLAHTR